jgi:hypothetical protein
MVNRTVHVVATVTLSGGLLGIRGAYTDEKAAAEDAARLTEVEGLSPAQVLVTECALHQPQPPSNTVHVVLEKKGENTPFVAGVYSNLDHAYEAALSRSRWVVSSTVRHNPPPSDIDVTKPVKLRDGGFRVTLTPHPVVPRLYLGTWIDAGGQRRVGMWDGSRHVPPNPHLDLVYVN